MHKPILICIVAMSLAGCAKSGGADGNVETIVQNTTSGLEHTASGLPDAEQANAVVNEGETILNVSNAGGDAAAKP